MFRIINANGEDTSFDNKEEEYTTKMANQSLTIFEEDNRSHYSIGRYGNLEKPTSIYLKNNKLIILILCTFFISCTEYITIYSAENKANDAYIWGEDLNVFFNNTNDEIDIIKIRKTINSDIIKKINNNKSLILKSDYVENLSGRYKYVILFKQDTFYVGPSKKSWMLKNHVILINNDSLISKILKRDEI